jgi:MoxR-like ATPase
MGSQEQLEDWRQLALRVEAEVAKAVIGQAQTIRLINVALFARGHVLLEGDVGVGKTTVLRAFSRAIGGDFERVEGTVDLMPGDLVYHTYVDAQGRPASTRAPCCAMANAWSPSSSTRSTGPGRRCSRCCCAPWPSAPSRPSTASTAFRT